jgi:hypothetical protein
MNRMSLVRDCKALHDAAWKTRLAVLALITFTQPACLFPIPLAIYPEIEPGSGVTIELCDHAGNPLSADGLMIIHRRFDVGPIQGAPSNSVVEIRDGKSKVPVEVTIGTAWMYVGINPSYAAFPTIGVNSGAITGVSWPTAIILVPGYNAEYCFDFTLRKERRESIRARLLTLPATQAAGWQKILDSLRRRLEKRKYHTSYDLRFDHYHYWKARNFIEAELRRMNTMTDKTNVGASNAEQDKTSHSIAR